MKQCCTDSIDRVLSEFTQNICHMDFNEEERRKVERSRQASLQQTELTSLVNQESDDPEEWLSVTQLNSVKGLKMINKQWHILQRQTKRKVAKEIAENYLLKRKLPKEVLAIVKEFSDIGADIEEYVKKQKVRSRCMEEDRSNYI